MNISTPANFSSSYLRVSEPHHGRTLDLYRQPSVLAGKAVEHLSGIGEGIAHCLTCPFGKGRCSYHQSLQLRWTVPCFRNTEDTPNHRRTLPPYRLKKNHLLGILPETRNLCSRRPHTRKVILRQSGLTYGPQLLLDLRARDCGARRVPFSWKARCMAFV